MPSTYDDPICSTNIPSGNAIAQLVGQSRAYRNSEDFVASLVAQLRASSQPAGDLEYTVGSLRTALGVHLSDLTSEAFGNRCSFCGKGQQDVRTLMVSAESTICDECAVAALHTISHTRGQFYLRVAFSLFRIVASLGRLFSSEGRKDSLPAPK